MTHCTSKFYFEKHYSYFLFFLSKKRGYSFYAIGMIDLNTVQLMFFYTGMLKFSTLKPVGIFSDFSPNVFYKNP